MNLNKFTKAELISKLKQNNSKLDTSKKINFLIKINTYLSQLWDLLNTFKNIIAKLTLISFFIQIFRKYKIFRKLWLMLNTIVMSIFGISLLDNLGFEFLTHFFKEMKIITWNVVDYLTNTHFYQYLSKLLSSEEETSNKSTNKNGSIISRNSEETIRSEENIRKSETNSKISDWLKPSQEVIEESNSDTNYKKYYIIAFSLILISSLSWYYSDEIRTGATSLIDWINSFRPGPGNGGGGVTDNNTTPTSTNFQGRQLDSQPPSPAIELIDKGKSKVLTSPSLEDLNNKAKDSWNEGSSSPGSDSSSSSTDTIKPSNINNYFEVSAVETAMFTITKNEWKTYLPGWTREKFDFIENNIHSINNFEIKMEIIKNLSNIEADLWELIKLLNENKHNISDIEILNLKLVIELTNNWVKEYNSKIFI